MGGANGGNLAKSRHVESKMGWIILGCEKERGSIIVAAGLLRIFSRRNSRNKPVFCHDQL